MLVVLPALMDEERVPPCAPTTRNMVAVTRYRRQRLVGMMDVVPSIILILMEAYNQ